MSDAYKIYEGKLYYVTLTVVGWIDVFTRKEYAYEVINNLKYCQEKKGLEIYAYVIMSNHLHMVCRVKEGMLSDVLRDFKSYTAKTIVKKIEEHTQESRKEWMMYMFRYFRKNKGESNHFKFWRNSNHAFELWTSQMIKQKIDYIHNNPVRSGMVEEPHHYIYSSANRQGLLKVSEL